MNRLTQLGTAFALLTTSSLTLAGTSTPGVDHREWRQSARIAHGVASNQLTGPETRFLVSQQRKTARLERAFKADGHVTYGERRILHRRLDRTSRSIYHQKHDRNFR